jgi:hypothetical protein
MGLIWYYRVRERSKNDIQGEEQQNLVSMPMEFSLKPSVSGIARRKWCSHRAVEGNDNCRNNKYVVLSGSSVDPLILIIVLGWNCFSSFRRITPQVFSSCWGSCRSWRKISGYLRDLWYQAYWFIQQDMVQTVTFD